MSGGGLFLEAGGWSLSGGQILGDRLEQQDRIGGSVIQVNGKEALLLLLADGMGGHDRGADAAEIAVERAKAAMEDAEGSVPDRLRTGLQSANTAIKDAAGLDDVMGATLVMAVLQGDQIWHASVGDSLLLLADGERVSRLNADHSMGGLLDERVRRGELTPEQAALDPRRHQLRSSLMGGDIALMDVPARPLSLPQEAGVILASDGLNALSPSDVSNIACKSGRAEVIASKLLEQVRASTPSGLDNTSVIICRRKSGKKWFSLFS